MKILTGNGLAWALLRRLPRRPTDGQNLLRRMLLDPLPRKLYRDWAVVASMIGVLQLTTQPTRPRGRRPGGGKYGSPGRGRSHVR